MCPRTTAFTCRTGGKARDVSINHNPRPVEVKPSFAPTLKYTPEKWTGPIGIKVRPFLASGVRKPPVLLAPNRGLTHPARLIFMAFGTGHVSFPLFRD